MRILLSLLSSALVFVGAEVVLRASLERDSISIRDGRPKTRFNPYVASSRLAFELRPDWRTVQDTSSGEVTVNTNGLGLRGRQASMRKPLGLYRVFVLGDSFAFGFGVEDGETLPARLEAALGGYASGVEVLNGGVPGWAADQYVVRLRMLGLRLEPDLVLVVLSENEPGDLAWHRLELGADRLPQRIQSERRMIDRHGRMRYINETGLDLPQIRFPGQGWLQDHSQLYNWVRYRLARLWIGRALAAGARARSLDEGEGPPGPIESLEPEQIQTGLETSAAFRVRYHRFLLKQVERIASEHGIALRFVNYSTEDLTPSPGSQGALMRADCDANPSGCFNTVQVFSPEDVDRFYFKLDGHPNPAGYVRVAGAVAEWLRADPSLHIPAPTGEP